MIRSYGLSINHARLLIALQSREINATPCHAMLCKVSLSYVECADVDCESCNAGVTLCVISAYRRIVSPTGWSSTKGISLGDSRRSVSLGEVSGAANMSLAGNSRGSEAAAALAGGWDRASATAAFAAATAASQKPPAAPSSRWRINLSVTHL